MVIIRTSLLLLLLLLWRWWWWGVVVRVPSALGGIRVVRAIASWRGQGRCRGWGVSVIVWGARWLARAVWVVVAHGELDVGERIHSKRCSEIHERSDGTKRENGKRGGRDQLLPSDNYVPTAYTPFFGPSLTISLSNLVPNTDMGSPLHPDAKRLRVSPCPARTLAIPQLIPQYTDNHHLLPPLGRHISHLVQTGYVISFPTRRPTKANYQLFFLFLLI